MNISETISDKNRQLDIFSTGFVDKKREDLSKYWLLTSRNNLLEILSSGLIKPRIFITKYYGDLREFCPIAIPLLTNEPTVDFIEMSTDLRNYNFPVLLQIEPKFIPGKCRMITKEYGYVTEELPENTENILCAIVKGVLPSSSIITIGFRDETELMEFRLRNFKNVPDVDQLLQVKEDFYSDIQIDFDSFINLLKKSHRKSTAIQKLTRIPEKLGGTLILITKLASIHPSFNSEELINVLRFFQNPGSTKTTIKPDDVNKSWLFGLAHILSDGVFTKNNQNLKKLLKYFDTNCKINAQEMLYKIAIEITSVMEKHDFSSDLFFEKIEKEIKENWLKFFDDKIIAEISDEISFIKKVVNNELSAEDYIAKYSQEEHHAGHALLHFILRKNPSTILNSIENFTKEDLEVLSMSLILAGLLNGRSRISVECYPDREMKEYIDYITAQYFNLLTAQNYLPELPDTFTIKETEKDGQKLDGIFNNGKLLLTIKPAEIIAVEGSAIADIDKERKEYSELQNIERAEQEASDYKTSILPENKYETAENFRKRLIEKDLMNVKTLENRIAIEICINERWFNLITTVIPLVNAEYFLEYQKTKKEIRLRGYIIPAYKLNNQEEFKINLQKLDKKYFDDLYQNKLVKLIEKISDKSTGT